MWKKWANKSIIHRQEALLAIIGFVPAAPGGATWDWKIYSRALNKHSWIPPSAVSRENNAFSGATRIMKRFSTWLDFVLANYVLNIWTISYNAGTYLNYSQHYPCRIEKECRCLLVANTIIIADSVSDTAAFKTKLYILKKGARKWWYESRRECALHTAYELGVHSEKVTCVAF